MWAHLGECELEDRKRMGSVWCGLGMARVSCRSDDLTLNLRAQNYSGSDVLFSFFNSRGDDDQISVKFKLNLGWITVGAIIILLQLVFHRSSFGKEASLSPGFMHLMVEKL